MGGASGLDPVDIITDGLTVAAGLLGTRSVAREFMMVFPDVRNEFEALLRPGDVAKIAIPCLNNDPAIREMSILVVLPDRAILAWSKGLFRRRVGADVIDLGSVRNAVIGSGAGGAAVRRVLTVTGTATWEIILLSDKPEFAEYVRSCFHA